MPPRWCCACWLRPTAVDLERLAAFGAAHGVRMYLQSAGLDSVRELGPAGAPLRYALPQAGVELEFAPTDFIQVNAAINAALVQRALELLEPTASSTVLDLFCGLGNFTLPLARRAARVVGVEGDAALIERARGNARRNGLGNAEFHVADLATAPAAAVRRGGRAPIRTCCSTRRGSARARCWRPWRPSRRSGCCIFPATREVWRVIWGCWCTSTALRSRRQV